MRRPRKTFIESHELACGKNYLKITISTDQLTLTYKIPFLLVMPADATQVVDIQRTSLVQIGMFISKSHSAPFANIC